MDTPAPPAFAREALQASQMPEHPAFMQVWELISNQLPFNHKTDWFVVMNFGNTLQALVDEHNEAAKKSAEGEAPGAPADVVAPDAEAEATAPEAPALSVVPDDRTSESKVDTHELVDA